MTDPSVTAARCPSPPLAEAVGLCISFRRQIAVDGVDLTVGSGEIVGLIGPNGAGKTTTLRMISGILPPDEGEVRICGHDLAGDGIEARRRMAFVPDDPRLFEKLTVWEQLRFIGALYGVDGFDEKAGRLLENYGLNDFRHALCGELSRGMRHKVGICCAFLYDPRVLLLDEPLAGLDPQSIRMVKETVRTHAAHGGGAVISSHLLPLIEDLCTHLLVLNRGKTAFHGTVADFRQLSRKGDADWLEEIFLRIVTETTVTPDTKAQ